MNDSLATWPWLHLALLAQVLLTLGVYLALAVAKTRALKAGDVDQKRRALHADAWPDKVQQINNNIRNQFELPVLFYVLGLLLIALGQTGVLASGLAWAFVLSRLLHAMVHTGSNVVPIRFRLFLLGFVLVLGMALLAGWTLLGG